MKNLLISVLLIGCGILYLRQIPQPGAGASLTTVAFTATPPLKPVNFFPEVRTLSGYWLRSVVVMRRDSDGFIVNTANKGVVKVRTSDLAPEAASAWASVAPMPQPTPVSSHTARQGKSPQFRANVIVMSNTGSVSTGAGKSTALAVSGTVSD